MKTQKTTSLSTSFLQVVRKGVVVFNILIISIFLSSCIFSENKAPSSDLSNISRYKPPNTNTHIVKTGETLYSIAWRYGLDYRTLAKMNGVGENYLIYAGKTLILSGKKKSVPDKGKKTSVSKHKDVASSSSVNKSTSSGSKSNVSRTSRPKTTKTVAPVWRPEKKSSSKSSVAISKLSAKSIHWRWPSRGRVITNFSTGKSANKGIDIRGKKGESVFAAATGKVVYAGSGLRGYGQLIIIKHNDVYLSAYAHNDSIRVREGQNVKAGQHIADIGSSGSRTESVKLHFEIRRNGQPINPLTLLPKRKT